ncbi:hypothetical protein ACFOLJ_28020 [Rugamonas sp. CCM 8940]|uniref:hypothetical protein n=1 Tax=Rugamonas sp. CCM 8940 TaxID=2765359 RepID=UPI0018F2A079|nr:hypothetical protein [Rugamonas sp. CCM 8940]MBJ7312043.1 hypothetical protein [Rugamonas sp. CCM 8940]
MTIFAVPVFDATVIFNDKELFKGRGAADGWGQKLAKEIECETTVQKVGTGWAIAANYEGEDCLWGIHGQRLKRIN